MNAPTDDDIVCIHPGCTQPATRERPLAVTADGDLIVELTCHQHEVTQ